MTTELVGSRRILTADEMIKHLMYSCEQLDAELKSQYFDMRAVQKNLEATVILNGNYKREIESLRKQVDELEYKLDNCAVECLGLREDRLSFETKYKQICRDAYEVYAGSEGIPQPETAAEAYLLRLLLQMKEPEFIFCKHCGSHMTDEELAEARKANPALISCCPDREMYGAFKMEAGVMLVNNKAVIKELRQDNEALRKQVDELEKERDDWIACHAKLYRELQETKAEVESEKTACNLIKHSKDYAFEDLRKAQARIFELREALEKLARLGNGACYGNSIGNQIAILALATRDDTSALEAYRNSVIDECMSRIDKGDHALLEVLKR